MDDAARRQHVERVPGSRRARLTPVPGTDTAPETRSSEEDRDATPAPAGTGPNDDRLRQDVPPHY